MTVEKAHVFLHPYLGIIAACRVCPRRPDMHRMLPPGPTAPIGAAWDQGSLAAANDVARAHMREQHGQGARCP